MSTHDTQDRIPYTYLIGWTKNNTWYYGSRTAKGCTPEELWVKYFTSSRYVAEFRDLFGEPDVIQVRRVFNNSKKCMLFEAGVIRRLISKKPGNWLNRTYFKGCSYYITDEIRSRMSAAKMGHTPWNKGLTKDQDRRLQVVSEKNSGPTGRIISQSHKEAIGLAWRGKKRPPRTQSHTDKIIQKKKERGTNHAKWNKESALRIRGRVGISHPKTRQKTRIPREQLDVYLTSGWILGWK